MREKDKIIEVKAHKVAYFVDSHQRLASYPFIGGKLDKETEIEIEQSPISFKAKHEEVLTSLGYNEEDILEILRHIHYY